MPPFPSIVRCPKSVVVAVPTVALPNNVNDVIILLVETLPLIPLYPSSILACTAVGVPTVNLPIISKESPTRRD